MLVYSDKFKWQIIQKRIKQHELDVITSLYIKTQQLLILKLFNTIKIIYIILILEQNFLNIFLK